MEIPRTLASRRLSEISTSVAKPPLLMTYAVPLITKNEHQSRIYWQMIIATTAIFPVYSETHFLSELFSLQELCPISTV